MAFNQDVQFHKQQTYLRSSETLITSSNASQENNTRYDELSSSSAADTGEWILFSPSMNELDRNSDKQSDVLSTSANDRESEFESYIDGEEEDDDDDDDASLLDSLEAHSPLKLSLPKHDGSGQFGYIGSDLEDESYLSGLAKNDYINNRIDVWRREQARILIDDLNQGSETSSKSGTNDLLASWGVEDSFTSSEIETATQSPTESVAALDNDTDTEETYSFTKNKRFHGDEVFKGLTAWEVDKIKAVAKQMSSSLKRNKTGYQGHDHLIERSQFQNHITKGRRLSILLSLSRATTNKYLFDNRNQPFWKQDISSAHSSLSLDTNSVMFGNMHIGDVI